MCFDPNCSEQLEVGYGRIHIRSSTYWHMYSTAQVLCIGQSIHTHYSISFYSSATSNPTAEVSSSVSRVYVSVQNLTYSLVKALLNGMDGKGCTQKTPTGLWPMHGRPGYILDHVSLSLCRFLHLVSLSLSITFLSSFLFLLPCCENGLDR